MRDHHRQFLCYLDSLSYARSAIQLQHDSYTYLLPNACLTIALRVPQTQCDTTCNQLLHFNDLIINYISILIGTQHTTKQMTPLHTVLFLDLYKHVGHPESKTATRCSKEIVHCRQKRVQEASCVGVKSCWIPCVWVHGLNRVSHARSKRRRLFVGVVLVLFATACVALVIMCIRSLP